MAAPKLLSFVVLVFLAGCGGSPFSASEQDEYNERVNEINDAWEEFRVAGNACTAPCFQAALESSGFVEAVGNFRSTVVKFQDNVDPGECRSSLHDLELFLGTIGATLDSMKYGEDDAVQTAASSLRQRWDEAVAVGSFAADACT